MQLEEQMYILKKNIEHYGQENQLRQFQEELAEAIVAVSHYLRNNSAENKHNLLEEIADITIMLNQIHCFILSKDDLETMIQIQEQKIQRLQQRLLQL